MSFDSVLHVLKQNWYYLELYKLYPLSTNDSNFYNIYMGARAGCRHKQAGGHRLKTIFTLSFLCHQRHRNDVFTRRAACRVTFRKRRLINKTTFELNNNVKQACETGDASERLAIILLGPSTVAGDMTCHNLPLYHRQRERCAKPQRSTARSLRAIALLSYL